MHRWNLLRWIAARERLWLHAEFMREANHDFPWVRRIPSTRAQAVLAVQAARKSSEGVRVHRALIDRQYERVDQSLVPSTDTDREECERLSSWYSSPVALLGEGKGHGWFFADAGTKRNAARALASTLQAGSRSAHSGINLDYFLQEADRETILAWQDFRSPTLLQVAKTALIAWSKYEPELLGQMESGEREVVLRAIPDWPECGWEISVVFEKPAFGGLGFSHRLLLKRDRAAVLEFRYDTSMVVSTADWDLVTPENLLSSLELIQRFVEKYLILFPVWLEGAELE